MTEGAEEIKMRERVQVDMKCWYKISNLSGRELSLLHRGLSLLIKQGSEDARRLLDRLVEKRAHSATVIADSVKVNNK